VVIRDVPDSTFAGFRIPDFAYRIPDPDFVRISSIHCKTPLHVDVTTASLQRTSIEYDSGIRSDRRAFVLFFVKNTVTRSLSELH